MGFQCAQDISSVSAFVQPGNKLLPETLEFLLHEFNSRCNPCSTYKGFRLLAIDGSELIFRNHCNISFLPVVYRAERQKHHSKLYNNQEDLNMKLKTIFSLILGTTLALSLVACGSNNNPAADKMCIRDSPGGRHGAPLCRGGFRYR